MVNILRGMCGVLLFVTAAVFVGVSGCATAERFVHMNSKQALEAKTFVFKDGVGGVYYDFNIGEAAKIDTFVFFYGGSGCPSWKQVMPGYVDGFGGNARVFALNKRFVGDKSLGVSDCGKAFYQSNEPEQWYSDLAEFIERQLDVATVAPKNIVLVGVSEGALVASRVATLQPRVTHLAIIGSGAHTVRHALVELWKLPGDIPGIGDRWTDLAADPYSIEKFKFGHTYRWWTSVLDIDPVPNYLGLNIPIFVGIGENDESHPAKSARELKEILNGQGKTNIVVRVYPGANHRLSDSNKSFRYDYFKELSSMMN